MGNNPSKSERPSAGPDSRPSSARNVHSHSFTGPAPQSPPNERPSSHAPSGRGGRPDLSSILSFGASHDRDGQSEVRRETKQEREARKLEKERVVREKERERSIREEGVDGGYLVTLGTYTGPEDFNKAVVRQLMEKIERRLAPFWKGLNDHSDSWTELQLVAAVKGLPIPAADEVPEDSPARAASRVDSNPASSQTNLNHITLPIAERSHSYNSDSASLGPSHPAFSSLPHSSPLSPQSQPASSPLFRGRAKTLASFTSKANSSSDVIHQETQLPKDPYVNGQAIEAYLYKDATECPICFLYYPPYLNRTRCCDQPICSECFVQIKRPDPHPPEHHDPSNPDISSDAQNPEEEGQLVSEPASCPFCVQPEFGITYEPPPFRRGLAYNAPLGHPLSKPTSAMSSSSSLSSGGILSPSNNSRRRGTSLSANAPTVITTDRVRPDWAKKLADARAHALRRSAAATALHNAAYVLGNSNAVDLRTFGLTGRRRRTLFAAGDSPGSSGNVSPRDGGMPLGNVAALLAAADRQGANGSSGGRSDGPNVNDLFPGRVSSRGARDRVEDIEELMMMEAIRLSLQAEEDRKRKEEKDARKEEKRERKQKKKDGKRRGKEMDRQKKQGGFFPVDIDGMEGSSSSVAGKNYIPQAEAAGGKGKAIDRGAATVGYNPLSEPTSTVNAETATASSSRSKDQPQQHLELRRSQLQNDSSIPSPGVLPPESFNPPNPPLESTSSLSSNSSSSSSPSSTGSSIDGPLTTANHDRNLDFDDEANPNLPLSAQLIEPVATTDTQSSTNTTSTSAQASAFTSAPALAPAPAFTSLTTAVQQPPPVSPPPALVPEVAPPAPAAPTPNRSRGDSAESADSAESSSTAAAVEVAMGNSDVAKGEPGRKEMEGRRGGDGGGGTEGEKQLEARHCEGLEAVGGQGQMA
ncbi:MAG: SNF1-interacting protein [Bathelium mastoideum]|nr:MAG: SNF1-interacting protein [Bathelium mastoideum]